MICDRDKRKQCVSYVLPIEELRFEIYNTKVRNLLAKTIDDMEGFHWKLYLSVITLSNLYSAIE